MVEEERDVLEKLARSSWAELGADWLEISDESGRAWLVERKTRREDMAFGESFREEACPREVWKAAGREKASGEKAEIRIALDLDSLVWSLSVFYPGSWVLVCPGEVEVRI